MSAIVSRTPTDSPASPQSQQAGAEASCPVGMLTLFAGALVWLLIASSLGLINSLKFHAPGFLAGQAWTSYGRVHAAQNAAFLYGFGVPAALGLGLWFLCRLGRATLVGPAIVFI